jgi:hypothetical protein
MKASEFANQILQDIQKNGGDFELAGVYWTEMEIEDFVDKSSKEEVIDLLGEIENAADQAGSFVIADN